jgi:hypothetical protein
VLVGEAGQRFVDVRHEQLLIQGFNLRLEFGFDDVELEAGLQQREHVLDIVHPTGNRFEGEDIFWPHELDHGIPRIEIAFAPLTNTWRQNQFVNHLLVEDIDATPIIVLEDALGTELFVLFVWFSDDIVS